MPVTDEELDTQRAHYRAQTERFASAGFERDVLRFFMQSRRVQETRARKRLPAFPCKPVGQVEFETFARTVDRRIATTCLVCPPDLGADGHCGWEFRLVPDGRSSGLACVGSQASGD
jgi:hypothetical protein